eukprot:gene1421-1647_t
MTSPYYGNIMPSQREQIDYLLNLSTQAHRLLDEIINVLNLNNDSTFNVKSQINVARSIVFSLIDTIDKHKKDNDGTISYTNDNDITDSGGTKDSNDSVQPPPPSFALDDSPATSTTYASYTPVMNRFSTSFASGGTTNTTRPQLTVQVSNQPHAHYSSCPTTPIYFVGTQPTTPVHPTLLFPMTMGSVSLHNSPPSSQPFTPATSPPPPIHQLQPTTHFPMVNPYHIDWRSTRLSHFTLLGEIGAGSFGTVRLCRHIQGVYFCLKILNRSRITHTKQIEHILNEKNIMLSISNPFIVKFSYLYFIMEYVGKGELFNYIRTEVMFEEHTAKLIIAEIVLALEYLHNQNIIYRDLKPENILVDTQGHIKLADFGFAKKIDENLDPDNGAANNSTIAMFLNGVKGHSKIIEFPEGFPEGAQTLVESLLNFDPDNRIGSRGDAAEIKAHPWFNGINWEQVAKCEGNGPFFNLPSFQTCQTTLPPDQQPSHSNQFSVEGTQDTLATKNIFNKIHLLTSLTFGILDSPFDFTLLIGRVSLTKLAIQDLP